ncbi:MAG: imidazolonepropionase-like amidohydrolase [Shewanella psychromarinicola]|jgi:imidazolonepropionase-like amidohydrolase|uniref:amidohydrolase family protein n=1 Tax=Shewanella psychromarinicola TaxID=2487742 RepID=UPI003EE969FA
MGANWIKITATGGVLSDTATGTNQQMTDDELTEIVRTAHSLEVKVAAHAHVNNGVTAALKQVLITLTTARFLMPKR